MEEGEGGGQTHYRSTEIMETKTFLQDLIQNCNSRVIFDNHQPLEILLPSSFLNFLFPLLWATVNTLKLDWMWQLPNVLQV